MPENPELREIAVSIDRAGIMGEILDHRFRCVFLAAETVKAMGASARQARAMLGTSTIVRSLAEETAELVRVTEESGREWFEHNVPIIRRSVGPEDADFNEVFGSTAQFAAEVEPAEQAPRAWHDRVSFPEHIKLRRTTLGDQIQVQIRINDETGRFIGVLCIYRGTVPDSLLNRLGRGDPALFERMEHVSEPARRPAAILFADLEGSGALSRRLSSRGYFDLVRALTDLIDGAVVSARGIVGKHAGDGGSALFLAADFDGSESSAARAAIEAARAIRDGSAELAGGPEPARINIGLHWGATLMVGQIATRGRLEVTALGDQMNEAARIEAASTGGAVLGSKDLIERLDPGDAEATDLDPDALPYVPLAEMESADTKVVRDAGTIPVARI